MLYGLVLAMPIKLAPSNRPTLTTDPSLSLALALITMLAGAVKTAPSAGLVMFAIGGMFGSAYLKFNGTKLVLAGGRKNQPLELLKIAPSQLATDVVVTVMYSVPQRSPPPVSCETK